MGEGQGCWAEGCKRCHSSALKAFCFSPAGREIARMGKQWDGEAAEGLHWGSSEPLHAWEGTAGFGGCSVCGSPIPCSHHWAESLCSRWCFCFGVFRLPPLDFAHGVGTTQGKSAGAALQDPAVGLMCTKRSSLLYNSPPLLGCSLCCHPVAPLHCSARFPNPLSRGCQQLSCSPGR